MYKSVQKDRYVESVKASLQLLESYKRFPSDSEFEKEIVLRMFTISEVEITC